MVRPPSFDMNGIKSGVWSKEEDHTLRAFVHKHGHHNWQKLPSLAGLARSGKSCRLRWVNYLQPGLKKGNFSKEEVDLIIRLHNKLGNKWSTIAEKLPGRTDNDIKNQWHAHIKKRRGEMGHEEESFEMNCCNENTNFEADDDRLLKREEELNDFGVCDNDMDSIISLISNSNSNSSDINEFSTLGLITYEYDHQVNTELPLPFPDQDMIHVSPQFSTLGLCNNHTPTFSADSSDGGGITYDHMACFNQLQFPEEYYYSDFGLCHNHTPITSSDSILHRSFW